MADRRRDEERRLRGEQRDPEAERRSDRQAERYRGSDERGYGGGERLGRDWERRSAEDADRYGRDERIRSVDDERLSRGREDRGYRAAGRDQGERRFRDSGRDRDVRRYEDLDRERMGRDSRDLDRDSRRTSPSGAFHDEGGRDFARYGSDMGRSGLERGRHHHYSMAGLHDLDDLSELRQRYSERRRQRDYQPRYGHGPGIENMEAPRLGYGTSTTRRESEDHELGHGGYLGGGTSRPPMATGRGPKGYQRSDDRIREDICDRLMMSWMDAENVDVLVKNGEVTLKGMVRSRDEKRAIEALAESVLGVKDIINELRLGRGEQAQSGASSAREQPSAQQPTDDSSLHS